MSRKTNESYYVPVGGAAEKTAVDRFIEKYDLPPLSEMLKAAALGALVFVAVAIVMLLTGARLIALESENGTDYRYFGWIYSGHPALGRLHGSDGTVAGVAGGKIYYSDGSVYDGETLQFMKHGNGTLTYNDGSVYRGGFKNDLFDGAGELICVDGSGYSGNYIEGLYEGQGTLKLSDGGSYTGEFLRGEFSGKGKLTYHNGDSFRGTFESNMRAEGVYYWVGGESIEGKFVNNMPSRMEKMIYTDASGDTYKAYFIDGELSEKSAYTRPDPIEPDDDDEAVG